MALGNLSQSQLWLQCRCQNLMPESLKTSICHHCRPSSLSLRLSGHNRAQDQSSGSCFSFHLFLPFIGSFKLLSICFVFARSSSEPQRQFPKEFKFLNLSVNCTTSENSQGNLLLGKCRTTPAPVQQTKPQTTARVGSAHSLKRGLTQFRMCGAWDLMNMLWHRALFPCGRFPCHYNEGGEVLEVNGKWR